MFKCLMLNCVSVKQDKILEKHIKLDYEVICPCPDDAIPKWEELFVSEVTYSSLESAIKYGILLDSY